MRFKPDPWFRYGPITRIQLDRERKIHCHIVKRGNGLETVYTVVHPLVRAPLPHFFGDYSFHLILGACACMHVPDINLSTSRSHNAGDRHKTIIKLSRMLSHISANPGFLFVIWVMWCLCWKLTLVSLYAKGLTPLAIFFFFFLWLLGPCPDYGLPSLCPAIVLRFLISNMSFTSLLTFPPFYSRSAHHSFSAKMLYEWSPWNSAFFCSNDVTRPFQYFQTYIG